MSKPPTPNDIAPVTYTALMRGSNLSMAHTPNQRVHVTVKDRHGHLVYPVTVRYFTNRVQLHVDQKKAVGSAWPLTITMTHVGKPASPLQDGPTKQPGGQP